LKCYYPDVFACAILNSLPMGFYAPAQLVGDARKHGVIVRPVDINHSFWDNTLEETDGQYCALRLGFRLVKGFRQADADFLVKARMKPYTSVLELRRVGLGDGALELLADADAFQSLNMDRRDAAWQVSVQDKPMPIFAVLPADGVVEDSVDLPKMSAGEHVIQDYATTTLSIKEHPVTFVREDLNLLRVTPATDLVKLENGAPVWGAGLVLVRQRPETASGVCFITLEDETGTANLVVFQQRFEKFRKEIMQSRLLMVEGKLQREGNVIHIIVEKCFNLNALLGKLTAAGAAKSVSTLARADEGPNLTQRAEPVIQVSMFPEGRNFR
jgi:error-prone DNA polymerase